MLIRPQPASPAIRLITALVFLILLLSLVSSFYTSFIWPVFLFLALVILLCYLTAPVAYMIEDNSLCVESRMSRKYFHGIKNCSSLNNKSRELTLRLWGNGGVFAATGIFWNRSNGIFRAYVTSADRSTYIMINTQGGRVLISPEDPVSVLKHCSELT